MKFKGLMRLAGVMLMLSVLFTACYQQEEINLDELDLTITQFDNTFDYQTYTKFAIADSVKVISDFWKDSDYTNFYKNGGANDDIKDYMKKKFQDLGYVYTNDDDYSFAVNMTLLMVENTTYVTYPGWWYYYPGYYYWYYPPYYPWYGYSYSYSYEMGTLVTEMFDGASVREYLAFIDGKTDEELDDLPPDAFPDVYVRWQSLVQGVLSSSVTYDQERFKNGIDEAFTQSPYLKKN